MLELATAALMAMTPAAGGLIGWGTNALAVRMLFEPLERRGLGPLAWQGVIPAQADRMATLCADLLLGRLITPQELHAQLEGPALARLLEPELRPAAEQALCGAISRRAPRLWRLTPRAARERVAGRAAALLPEVVDGVLDEVGHDLDRHLDLRGLIVQAFRADRALLGELFRRCGAAEFRFVIATGLICGVVFGLLQLLAWATVGQPPWVFPLVGALTGGATNWLALWLVFSPARPIQLGPWRLQGLFLKRQPEVSAAYAEFFASRVLQPARLLEQLRTGPAAERYRTAIERHVARAMERSRGAVAVQLAVGDARWCAARDEVARELADHALGSPASPALTDYVGARLQLEDTLRARLQALPPEEFVAVLRPVFQAEEWRLTAIGAALGAAAGLLQALPLLL